MLDVLRSTPVPQCYGTKYQNAVIFIF
jgi:hypothetical protein